MKSRNWLIFFLLFFIGCKKNEPKNNPIVFGESYGIAIRTDKSFYNPGETVSFTTNKILPGNIKIRYSHLGEVLSENNLATTEWHWTPPATNYKGYLADVYEVKEGIEVIHGSIAVDVSSNWTRF